MFSKFVTAFVAEVPVFKHALDLNLTDFEGLRYKQGQADFCCNFQEHHFMTAVF